MILFLDTETTGLYPGNICQLSYICQDKGKASAKNFFFKVDFVEYGALKVHGFSVEKLQKLSGGKEFCLFAEEIAKDIEKADVVCAHNTAFDFMFLSKELSCATQDFIVNKEFCTMKNSVSACKLMRSSGRGYKYPKLNELCAFLGITDAYIEYMSEKLFGTKSGYHDARFDTTAVFLAVNSGVDKIPAFEILKEQL